MGTRGLYGYKIDGETKITYNHYDSYPSGLGKDTVKYIVTHSMQDMITAAKKIEMVEDLDDFYYNKLRYHQGCLNCYHNDVDVMIDNRNFLEDSLFCEWAYIINLDELTLEIYIAGDYLAKVISLKRIQERSDVYLNMMDNELSGHYSKRKVKSQWSY
jgi:hypothetical protein